MSTNEIVLSKIYDHKTECPECKNLVPSVSLMPYSNNDTTLCCCECALEKMKASTEIFKFLIKTTKGQI